MTEDRARDISGPVLPASVFDGPGPHELRATFRAADRQERFEREGYCVVPFLDAEQIAAVWEVWDAVGPAPGDDLTGFFPGNASTSQEWKREVIRLVTPIVAASLDELFDDHHAFHIAFMAKWPGPAGRLQVHQDSTMVAPESSVHGLNVWCPLDPPLADGDPERGTLRIVPGSHRLETSRWYRGRNGFIPAGFDDLEEVMLEHFAQPVPLGSGQAIAFQHRLIHGSWANETDHLRLALAVGLRPADARNIHVECDRDGWVDVYTVDDEYFIRHPDVDMADYPHEHRVPRVVAPTTTLDDLVRVSGIAAPPIRLTPTAASTPTPTPTVDEPEPVAPREETAEPAPPRAFQRRSVPFLPRRRVLVDRDLDQRLHRDGFVTVPLLAPDAVASLRADIAALGGWDGEGFETDLWSPDLARRSEADRRIAAATDGPIGHLFVDHVPFLRGFAVKHPGPARPDAIPQAPHRDWMYTDERRGTRSVVVRIALDDIQQDNGQLRVARGSHRIDDTIRGPGIGSRWLDDLPFWDRRLLAVPLPAGHALVADAALVHCSYGNHSGADRLSCSVAVAPRSAELVHYQPISDDLAACYLVDPAFFLEQDVDALRSGAIDRPVIGEAEIGPLDYRRRTVAAVLDRQPLAILDHLMARLHALRPDADAAR